MQFSGGVFIQVMISSYGLYKIYQSKHDSNYSLEATLLNLALTVTYIGTISTVAFYGSKINSEVMDGTYDVFSIKCDVYQYFRVIKLW